MWPDLLTHTTLTSCSVSSFVPGSSSQSNFNFATWDNWAKTVSANPSVKILLGIPASSTAGTGYATGTTLEAAIQYSKAYSSFGGVMMWDMSQLYENSGFLAQVVSDLEETTSTATTTLTVTTLTTSTTATGTTTSMTTTTTTTTATTTTATGTGTPVAQWGQCGGNGYTGSTTCASPYSCTCLSQWWCQCE